jgi:hypothetical protein
VIRSGCREPATYLCSLPEQYVLARTRDANGIVVGRSGSLAYDRKLSPDSKMPSGELRISRLTQENGNCPVALVSGNEQGPVGDGAETLWPRSCSQHLHEFRSRFVAIQAIHRNACCALHPNE